MWRSIASGTDAELPQQWRHMVDNYLCLIPGRCNGGLFHYGDVGNASWLVFLHSVQQFVAKLSALEITAFSTSAAPDIFF